MLFEKPSLRTRSTFEIAVRELGGDTLHLPAQFADGVREPLEDVARNLERWVHALVIRTYAQEKVAIIADGRPPAARHQRADRRGASVSGAGRHVDAARALGRLPRPDGRVRRRRQQRRDVAGTRHVACSASRCTSPRPHGYELPDRSSTQRARIARDGAEVRRFTDPREAVAGVDAVYTDVWTSMGQEAEADQRRRSLRAVSGERQR